MPIPSFPVARIAECTDVLNDKQPTMAAPLDQPKLAEMVYIPSYNALEPPEYSSIAAFETQSRTECTSSSKPVPTTLTLLDNQHKSSDSRPHCAAKESAPSFSAAPAAQPMTARGSIASHSQSFNRLARPEQPTLEAGPKVPSKSHTRKDPGPAPSVAQQSFAQGDGAKLFGSHEVEHEMASPNLPCHVASPAKPITSAEPQHRKIDNEPDTTSAVSTFLSRISAPSQPVWLEGSWPAQGDGRYLVSLLFCCSV
jgi:hypothetical protein